MLCGCGKAGKYTHFKADGSEVYSCNKHQRCRTREELEEACLKASSNLLRYIDAINKIDDYFEYANESIKDRKKVYQILGNLTESLK